MALTGMNNLVAIKGALDGWIQDDAGYRLVWANQQKNPALRDRPYVLLQILRITKNGDDGYIDADATPTIDDPTNRSRNWYGQRTIVLQVSAFAEATGDPTGSALDIASALQDSLSYDTVTDRFRDVAMAVASTGEVRDLTILEGPQPGGRATFDLTLNYTAVSTTVEKGDFVQAVFGTGDILDPDDADVTIDVDPDDLDP